VRRRSVKIFQCLASLLFARRADALSLFCAQFEEVYIYIQRESRREYREQQRARIVQRERKREVSLR
jgi:hypothetical protein